MPRERVIVVGTDFTEEAARAVARAAALSRELGAALHVVHAPSRLPRALAQRFADGRGEEKERALFERVVSDLSASGLRAEGHWVPGGAPSVLKRKARALKADVVVVGARGRKVADAVLGSTAERVVAASGLPVLIARDSPPRSYRTAIVAADVDSELRRADALARLVTQDAPIAILHAYEGPFETKMLLQGVGPAAIRDYRSFVRKEAQKRMSERLVAMGLEERTLRLVHGNRRTVLAHAAVKGTLLVLARSESATRHLLLGSVSRWVIEHTSSDILLV